jgi:hypothetical protein
MTARGRGKVFGMSALGRGRIALLAVAIALASAMILPLSASAATVVVVNNDGPGEGFNDPTALAPVGGNTGTTLGAQRLNAFQYAANIWGGLLTSPVTIRVGANFDPQPCNASSTVLGAAGATEVFRDFAGAPQPGTWYPPALANALSGTDLDPQNYDIAATFNSAIGTTCPFPNVWYYGLDGNPPSGQIDFVSVVVHELCHGLGFQTFMSITTGAKLNGFDDTFELNLEDHGATPSDFPGMTNAQRLAAVTDTGNLHWVGANVMAASGVLTAGTVGTHVRMYAPNPSQAGSSVSHWDTVLTPDQVMEPIYTGVHHTPVLELPALEDIGWILASVSTSPTINVQPGSKSYGTVSVGATSDQTFTVKNTGTATLHVSATSVTNLAAGTSAGEFFITNGVNAFTLAPSATQSVTVRFAPAGAGSKGATLQFTSDDPATPTDNVALSGSGQTVSANPQLTALGPAKMWVGLGSSTSGIKFDVKAVVSVNSSVVGSGQVNSVSPGMGTSVNGAKLSSIPLSLVSGAAAAPSGSTLKIQVLARNACSGSTASIGTARLWFNGKPVDTGLKSDTGSRFSATVGSASNTYYLRSGSVLSTTAGAAHASVSAVVGTPCGPFVPFGTWSVTLP